MTASNDPGQANPNAGLFDDLPEPSAEQVELARAQAAAKRRLGAPRLLQPNRSQVELRASDLESLLGQDHRARLVWRYVERQDLSALYDAIKARGSVPGRPPIDPRILFALWLYATLDGVGSGREVDRLSREHDAYRWICGGVAVNYHALNDFRAGNDELMDELLTDNVAALAAVGAITLERVAQDGMRVRADAGAASFRRHGRLEEHLAQARELVRTLKAQAESDPGQASRQAQAAQLRAARRREECIDAALERLPEVAAAKRRSGAKAEDARASTTDADASVMKMGDGGFRPAYNVQFATTCDSQVIVGMDVVTAGSDMAQLAPMVAQVERRLGEAPAQWLVDGGFPAHAQIDAVAGKTELYAPVPKARPPKPAEPAKGEQDGKQEQAEQQQSVQDRAEQDRVVHDAPETQAGRANEFTPRPDDSLAVADWRQRMNTDAAREVYKQRAATAECANAQARNRGLLRMPVRSLAKVKCVVLLFVLAHNLMRIAALAPHLIGWTPAARAMTA
jgi:transposase